MNLVQLEVSPRNGMEPKAPAVPLAKQTASYWKLPRVFFNSLRSLAKSSGAPPVSFSRKVGFLIRNPRVVVNYLKMRISSNGVVLSHGPSCVVFYSTDTCNMKCTWCLREVEESKDLRHRPISDLTMDGFKKILGRLPYLTSLSFAGQGEPLLNPEMFDLLEYSARRVLRIYLISNALTLNDSSARRLLKIPGLNILFSLKGKDAAEFAEITCLPERLFDQQMENIRRIAELRNTTRANLYLRAGYVLTKRNYRYMNEVISLVEGLGVDRLQFDNLVPLHNMEEGTGSLYEDDVEVREYIEELKKIPRKVRIDYPTLIRNHSHTYYCRGFVEMPGIDAHGNLTGCMRVRTPQPEQGNIFRDADFMNNPHFLEARQGFLNKQIPTQCKTCVEMSGIDLL